MLTTRLDLVADIDRLVADIAGQLTENACSVVVIDTLNRSLVGSESRDEDMSAYVKAADQIREKFHCTVIVVHHCGTNDSRPRGHTSLSGAADAQIAVKRDAADNVIAELEFLKDGPAGEIIVSRLVPVEVDLDEDGEPITSCVVEPVEGAEVRKSKTRVKLSSTHQICLNALAKAICEAGEDPPESNHIPAGLRVVPIEKWRYWYYAVVPAENEKAKQARKRAFHRTRQALQTMEPPIIRIWSDLAWIVPS